MPSTKKKKQLEVLLAEATEAQHAFWDIVGDLEKAMGIDIDDLSQDFANITISDLRSRAKRAA